MARERRQSIEKRLNDLRAQLDRLGYGPDGTHSGKIMSAEDLRRAVSKPRPRRGAAASDKPEPPAPPTASAPILYSRNLPRTGASRPAPTKAPEDAPPVVLESAAPGTEVPGPLGGTFYLLSRAVADIPGAEDLDTRFLENLDEPGTPLHRLAAGLLEDGAPAREDFLFMDVESTGLGSAQVFLVGVLTRGADGLQVRQFLARNYAEERAVVAAFCDLCARHRLLVTFNGKSFDFPFLRMRAAACGVPFALSPAHLDLLHVSRRYWRATLPNCKLQTLERCICRRLRHGDIPGSEIPEAYHRYVRTEDAREVVEILKHNMLDLVTLADLMTRFPDEC